MSTFLSHRGGEIMKNLQSGFLVVLKFLPQGQTLYNPHYKGIDRTPPFSLEEYQAGFDDPYLSRNYINSDGLIPSMELAKEALKDFSQIERAENLETIFVQEWDKVQTEELSGYEFLGYDVAADRPFWSIVNDSPSPEDPRFKAVLSKLNEYGLFADTRLAEEYLEIYSSQFQNKHARGLKIWAIYRVVQI